MGDLKHSRTVHSLIDAAKLFNIRIFLISPAELRISSDDLYGLKRNGTSYSFHRTAEEVIEQLDCLYLTRLQKERFNIQETITSYRINLATLSKAKPNLKILHPLPRREEPPDEIADTPYAYYFEQVKNGLFIRQALLEIIFGS